MKSGRDSPPIRQSTRDSAKSITRSERVGVDPAHGGLLNAGPGGLQQLDDPRVASPGRPGEGRGPGLVVREVGRRAPGEQELDHVRDVAAGSPGQRGRTIIIILGGDVRPGFQEDRSRIRSAAPAARPRPSPQRSCRGVAFCQSGRSGSMPLSSSRRSRSGSLQRYERQAVTMGGTRAPASSSRTTRSRLPRVHAAVNTPPQPEFAELGSSATRRTTSSSSSSQTRS